MEYYKEKLLEFYDIYWRCPSRREFVDFMDIDAEDLQVALFRDALQELHFQKVSRPTKTIEVLDINNEIVFIGTSKDLSDELEMNQAKILQLVDTNVRCPNGYMFRTKPYVWRHPIED